MSGDMKNLPISGAVVHCGDARLKPALLLFILRPIRAKTNRTLHA